MPKRCSARLDTMADIISNFLEHAKMAKDDPQIQAGLAAEFALEAQPEPERAALRAAMDGAALLHWFDADLLEKMLNISTAEALERLEALKSLPFVERYRRGESGSELHNVHEATRLGWRRQLARENPDSFRGLSIRAAACFADDRMPIGRIEYIYHILCGDPERGASELERLSRDWIGYAHARPEDYYALSAAMRELEDTGFLQGRARAATLLTIGWGGEMRGEIAQLGDLATEALRLAQDSTDRRMESEAQCLVGDVLQAQGQLAAAQAAFANCLAIRRQLARQDPDNTDCQRELAVAHSRVGDVLKAQDQLTEARAAFDEYLVISRRLAEQDQSNAGWQRELAIAHGRVGSVLQAQDQLTEARAAFDKSLTISRRLAEQDQSNADLQRGLASACSRLARAEAQASKNKAALKLYEESLRILTDLVARAPELVAWQKARERVEAELNAFRKKHS
jgi:tetratricopeptide (TPR) repeat protein